ncbi:glutamine-hydrolyzing carbamoyl-phosphate synthase small subunit [Ningiella sp. W23]|uniref:glutamine-hydrolyzing carbamoyl-phosphate synthase small subunit n=1 Tax=Ningiella sp. W23 TaxID=3023715 RepID=UPI0037573A3D
MSVSALLVLADGSVFKGTSIGAQGHSAGEVVFNTSMTGYQEILTDPSYAEQIITLTYPHIGNTGTNSEDVESDQIWAKGLVIRDLPLVASNFRNTQTLSDYLKSQNIVGIADIDTRRLTRVLREKGAQNGCIMTLESPMRGVDAHVGSAIEQALKHAKAFPGLKGMDLAKVVSCDSAYSFNDSVWSLEGGYEEDIKDLPHHVVAYDFGAKKNILRMLVARGCRLTVVPAQTSAEEVLALKPDGIFLSNGPGDPEPCDYAIEATKRFLAEKLPLFGICLGHQILAIASGASTEKMLFGHHGANHPVQDTNSGGVMITSQNHGFAVDANTLPENVNVTHVSLFDKSLQGIALRNAPAFSFQGHPEASPGPQDASPLFDHFIDLILQYKKRQHQHQQQ